MNQLKRIFAMSVLYALGYLPMGFGRCIGSGIGRIMWLVQGRNAKVTLKNLCFCFPDMSEKEREVLAQKSLRESGKFFFEAIAIFVRSNKWVSSKILSIHGEAFVQKAIAEKKGLILLSPHIGNWEVIGLELANLGELTVMYLPPKIEFLNGFFRRSRERKNYRLVPANVKGVASLIAALQKPGGVTGVLPDQCPKSGGVYAPFFGVPAYTMTLVNGLIRKTGARVVACVGFRKSKGFELHYFEAPEAIYDENKTVSATAMNQLIEKTIALAPEQYSWEYKRFKGRNRYECPYRNEGMAPPGDVEL